MSQPKPSTRADAGPSTLPASRAGGSAFGADGEPAAVQAPRPLGWLVGLGPRTGAALLALSAVLAVAGMAWGLSTLFSPLGAGSAVAAAALGMLVLLLPLMALLLKLAHELERARVLLQRFDLADNHQPLASRGQFMALVEREFARARRYGSGAAVAIVEVDRFRRLAELRGPAAGEAVMRELAALVGHTLRGADALAQYAPSQLVVFLAHSDPTGALDASERIRERAEALEVLWREQRIRLSVSVGVVTMRPAHQQVGMVIDEVQAALEAARRAGGNCVRLAPVDYDARGALPGSQGVGDNQAAGPL